MWVLGGGGGWGCGGGRVVMVTWGGHGDLGWSFTLDKSPPPADLIRAAQNQDLSECMSLQVSVSDGCPTVTPSVVLLFIL